LYVIESVIVDNLDAPVIETGTVYGPAPTRISAGVDSNTRAGGAVLGAAGATGAAGVVGGGVVVGGGAAVAGGVCTAGGFGFSGVGVGITVGGLVGDTV
jgi:hypothetical protein